MISFSFWRSGLGRQMANKIQTVMLIDDEMVDQKQYKRVLRRSGLVEEILTFTYADEAFEFLKSNGDIAVDVIFLDINMPRMNGFEFLERVESELDREIANTVIIMSTTSLDSSDRARASQFDIVRDFISKPLEVENVEYVADLCAELRD